MTDAEKKAKKAAHHHKWYLANREYALAYSRQYRKKGRKTVDLDIKELAKGNQINKGE